MYPVALKFEGVIQWNIVRMPQDKLEEYAPKSDSDPIR